MSEPIQNTFHLCSICQNSYPIDQLNICSVCNSLICNNCTDAGYEMDWDEVLCIICSELYNRQKERYCFKDNCDYKLNFFHARINTILSLEEFIKVWNSPIVEFYCCECLKFEKIKRSIKSNERKK